MAANLTPEQMVALVETSIARAEHGLSRLTRAELEMPFHASGRKVRHLLNNLLSVPGTRYLEIGLFHGSTFCAALTGNAVEAHGLDHWGQFGGRDQFQANLTPERVGRNRVQVFDHDCWTFDRGALGGGIEVYFYDGDHSREAQRQAFTVFDDVLAPVFVAVVDDWFYPGGQGDVQGGTRDAFAELGYEVLHERVLGEDGRREGDRDGYWHGLGVFVLEKPAAPRARAPEAALSTAELGAVRPDYASLSISSGGRWALEATVRLAGWEAAQAAGLRPPLITAVMAVSGAAAPVEAALRSFSAQTHAARELLVIEEGDGLAGLVGALGDPAIRHLRHERRAAVGPLLLAEARGEILTRWDACDLADPERLTFVAAATWAAGLDAGALARRHEVWPARQVLATSARGLWENTFWVRRAAAEPPLARGGSLDARLLGRVGRRGRLGFLDAPGLCLHLDSSDAGGPAPGATALWPAPHYEPARRSLARRFPGLLTLG